MYCNHIDFFRATSKNFTTLILMQTCTRYTITITLFINFSLKYVFIELYNLQLIVTRKCVDFTAGSENFQKCLLLNTRQSKSWVLAFLTASNAQRS